jgi:RND family efflux transporter MFP subunit
MQLPSGFRAYATWRIALFVAMFLIAGAYFFIWSGNNLGATLTISPRDFIEQVSVSGTVIAAKNVALGFAANGRITGVYARVGQHVEAGTILAETENGDLTATLTQKQAMLAQKQADLASLRSGTRPEELAVASASVANAEAALVNAIQNAYTASDDAVHNRADALFTNPRTNPKLVFTAANANLEMTVERDRAAIEPVLASWALLVAKLSSGNAIDSAKQSQTYIAQVTALLADTNAALNQGVPDQTTSATTLASYATALATARANVNAAATTLTTGSSALDAAQNTLALKRAGSTGESIVAAAAAVSAAAAEVENARAQLVKTRVVAPFSGAVTRMDAKVGEIVSPTVSVIALQSDGLFEIETFIPEVSIARIAVGNPATTTLDAYGSSVFFAAKVVAVDPAETVKDGVPTYKATLAFLAADPRIRSGMTADVAIETGVLRDAIVIPAGAVGKKDSAPYVSAMEGKEVANRPVITGQSPSLGQVEIVSGLSAGDVILLKPAP